MGFISTITEWRDRRREEATLGQNMRRMEMQSLRLSNRRLAESLDTLDNYIDPREPFYDDGRQWVEAGSGNLQYGVPFGTQGSHDEIRAQCRRLAHENEFAIGILETRISYIVGTGHVYDVEPKNEDDEVQDADRVAVMEVIDEFQKINEWHNRQQEIMRRLDRDGEVFLRFFEADHLGEDGETRKVVKVRFVEPSQVRTPEDKTMEPASDYGIKTEEEDVETVLGYYIDGKFVDAEEIQHRKRNVDRNCKRGLSLLYACRKNLPRAEKIIRNAAATVEIQAAVGMVRKHAAATQDAVQSFVAGKRDAYAQRQTLAGTTKTTNFQQFQPGTILDVPGTTEYNFPTIGLDPSKPTGVVQMVLRATGSRVSLPEFMVSGDASNANYASTLVSEGPAVKMFQREQWLMIEEDEKVFDRVLALAVEQGRLGKDVLERVKVHAEPPTVISRDELKEAQKDQILVNIGAKSIQTVCLERGLKYEKEQTNMEEHTERTGGSMVRAMLPGDIPDDPLAGEEVHDVPLGA